MPFMVFLQVHHAELLELAEKRWRTSTDCYSAVNEPVDPNVCGCRHSGAARRTGMLPGNVRGHRLTSSRASGRNTIAAFALSIALGGARCGGIRRRNKNGNHNSHLKNGVTNARSSLCHIAMKTRIKNAKRCNTDFTIRSKPGPYLRFRMRIRKRRYGPGFERIVKSVLHLFAFLILVFIAIWHKELLAFVTPFFRWLL